MHTLLFLVFRLNWIGSLENELSKLSFPLPSSGRSRAVKRHGQAAGQAAAEETKSATAESCCNSVIIIDHDAGAVVLGRDNNPGG